MPKLDEFQVPQTVGQVTQHICIVVQRGLLDRIRQNLVPPIVAPLPYGHGVGPNPVRLLPHPVDDRLQFLAGTGLLRVPSHLAVQPADIVLVHPILATVALPAPAFGVVPDSAVPILLAIFAFCR